MTPPPEDSRRPGVYARLAQQADVERAVLSPPRGARVAGWIICLAIVAGVVAAAVGAHPW